MALSLPLREPNQAVPPNGEFEEAFAACEQQLGLTLTVHDLVGAFRAPDGRLVLAADRFLHRHPCCQIVHDERCLRHCLSDMNEQARQEGGPFTHTCWKAVRELVVPLVRGQTHVATLFAGVFRPQGPHVTPDPPDLPIEFHQAWRRLPMATSQTLMELAPLLQTFAEGLVHKLDRLHRDATGDPSPRGRILRFLWKNAHAEARLADLAAELGLSESRTSHVVREQFGMSFRSLLHQERLRRAQAVLLGSDVSIAEAGRQVGLPNPYHFSRAFRAAFGVPPSEYRRRRHVRA